MARPLRRDAVWVVISMVVALVSIAEATPPGIANNPSNARCLIKKYKHCYNLEHVCPKFCPNSCTVECVSCKPICGDGSTAPPTDSVLSPSPPEEGESPPKVSPPPDAGGKGKGGENGDDTGKGKGDENGKGSPTPSSPPSPIQSTPPPPTPSSNPSPPPPAVTYPTPSSSPPPTLTLNPSPPTPFPPPPSTPTSTPQIPTESTQSPTPTPTPSSPTPLPPTSTPSSPPQYSPPPTVPTLPTPSPLSPISQTPPLPPSPPTSHVPTPPNDSSEPARGRRKRCKNKNYSQCYLRQHVCPSSCPDTCEIDCVTCKPVCKCDMPGAVCQDPRFIGADGLTFYFHGKKNRDFCLVSDPNLHINAHFIGRRNENMQRDFTWVQSIAILFGDHQLFVGADKTATWDDAIDRLTIALDDEPVSLPVAQGSTCRPANLPSATLTRDDDANSVVVEVEGLFRISAKVVPISQQESIVHNYGITGDDCFAHLELGFKFFSLSDKVDGVLGQTYRSDYVSRANMGAAMPVLGGQKEFAVSTLYGTDCQVSKFRGAELQFGKLVELTKSV